MKKIWKHLPLIASLLLIILFVYTAMNKLRDVPSFIFVIERSPLLRSFAQLLGWTIPLTELMLSVFLIIPAFRKRALLFSGMLMAMFSVYVAFMLLSSSHLPCYCGGIINKLNWGQHLVVNILFTATAFAGWLAAKKSTYEFHHSPDPSFYSNKPFPVGNRAGHAENL